jgi:acyl-lipid omega-6 desaturase (Delta-12 desaturase)
MGQHDDDIWSVGLAAFLVVALPIIVFAATAGVWLFYVQHQFERTTWRAAADWSPPEAALHGSSYYRLPPPLRWFSANIGVHHVHHLASGIPFYRLPEVLRNHPALGEVGRLSLWKSFACVRLALWDEDKRRLVSFREAAESRQASGGAQPSTASAQTALFNRRGATEKTAL